MVDFRAYLTQNLVNLPALENYIAAKHNFAAAKLTAEDARDLVVLTVGNAYLLCIADAGPHRGRQCGAEDTASSPSTRRPPRMMPA